MSASMPSDRGPLLLWWCFSLTLSFLFFQQSFAKKKEKEKEIGQKVKL
jgi:hypothetical protein